MNASSDDGGNGLNHVTPRRIYLLLGLIHHSSVRNVEFIKGQFNDRERFFAETLQFVEALGWVHSGAGRLEPAHEVVGRISRSAGGPRDVIFCDAFFDCLGGYQKIFAAYLSRFEKRGSALVYRPSPETALSDGPVRDFLMNLGAVSHNAKDHFYTLDEEYWYLGVWGRNASHTVSARALEKLEEDRHCIGRAAELAILEWERGRVGNEWRNKVQHVAANNPYASYDLESVTLVGERTEPRFIEVKAVPADTLGFYWSAREIEAAEILTKRYFLYLVPVMAGGSFNLAKLEIIQDPYHNVYEHPSWSKWPTSTYCEKSEVL